jgi:iron-only hydrogenase group A
MLFNVEVNNRKLTAKRDETILALLNRVGLHIPTICHMSGFSPTGACRMCVVEVDGMNDLVPACSQPVEEWMKIHTHSSKVIAARRSLVELLLANHPDDCLYCDKSGLCELQKLADELNITERKFQCKKRSLLIDRNCPSIERNPAKCILCGRCIRVCDEVMAVSAIDFIGRGSNSSIGTIINKGINEQTCVKCGQCIMVCPTDAIKERSSLQKVIDALYDKQLHCVIQFSPTVPSSIAEEFGLKSGKDIVNLLKTAMISIGFRQVFDTSFSADLTILNVANEFMTRWKIKEKLPMFTSCCPSWTDYLNVFHPDFQENRASTGSPQEMMGNLIKNDYGRRRSIPNSQIYSVSVMPCTAKKKEAITIPEEVNNPGKIDAVITTRELIKLIKLFGINFSSLEQEPVEAFYSIQSSAGRLFGTAGGALEGIARTIYFNMTGQDLPGFKINELRGLKSRKEVRIRVGKQFLGLAAVSGLANAKLLLDEIRNGRQDLHLIEVMACPSGCINGGGQRFENDEKTLKSRMKSLYDADEEDMIRAAHKNPLMADYFHPVNMGINTLK